MKTRSARDAWPKVLIALWLVVGVSIFVWLARALWPFTVDDTFITLVYGRNLFEGNGPVYNVGERAEGYTTFGWMLFTAALHALPFDPELLVKLGSFGATLAAVTLAAFLASELVRPAVKKDPFVRARAAAIAAAIVLVYPGTVVHAVSGMETALFCAACMALWLVALRITGIAVAGAASIGPSSDAAFGTPPDGGEGSLLRAPSMSLFAVLALAAGMVRPDGNLVAITTGVMVYAQLPKALRRAFLNRVALLYVLPGALYFIWRYRYYGHLLPLPFYVKAGYARLSGLGEARDFLVDLAWGCFPIGALSILGARWQWRRALPLLVSGTSLFLFYLFPAPLMAYEHRYLHFLSMLAASLAGAGLAEAIARIAERRLEAARWCEVAAFALFVVLIPTRFFIDLSGRVGYLAAYGVGLHRAHIALAKKMSEVPGNPREHTIAALDAGAIPYVSRWYMIDTWGLNNPYVALNGRSNPAYILDQKPELLVTVSSRGDAFKMVFDYEGPLLEEAQRRGYAPVASFEFVPDYHLWVLARDGRAPWTAPTP